MTHLGGEGADHTLASADIKPTGEGPKVYAITHLKPYLKPGLEEELGAPIGAPADGGTEVVCACVPADTCACNTVAYHVEGAVCPGDCPCQCQVTCSCESVCHCQGTCYGCSCDYDCGMD